MEEELIKLRNYIRDSNEVIEFKLIRHPKDVEDDSKRFRPQMSHQIFEHETIYGYRNLCVKLYYSAGCLDAYLGMTYSDMATKTNCDDPEPQEVLPKIAQHLPPNPYSNIDEFIKNLEKDKTFKPEGRVLLSFSIDDNGEQRRFEVYTADMSNEKFKAYHKRLQTFLLWYVDAASFIDTDDNQWHYFNMYEKFKDEDNATRYASVGCATVYEYYAYPEHIRPRIAQFLILPPFQRKGLGKYLLKAIYEEYVPNEKIKDITVEDPSEHFQRLRDYVDCQNCSKLPAFSKDKLKEGFSESMVDEARTKLKINKKQARRIYEILRLKATNLHNEDEYREYRLSVKRRLNCPYKKEEDQKMRIIRSIRAGITDEEEMEEYDEEANSIIQDFHRIHCLDKEFKKIEEIYMIVVKRLSRDD